ncbi:MAG: hypothetical protein KGZ39_04095 [Simkania sp.]|nr:hypothetical protein [Simkania sp.]
MTTSLHLINCFKSLLKHIKTTTKSVFFHLLPLFFTPYISANLIDLEDLAQDFVLETKKIEIPLYPGAFNPSIIRWHGNLLMSFRVIQDPKHSFNSQLGIIWLDEEFNPISEPQLLNTRDGSSNVPSRAEDGKLIAINDQLFMVYSDNTDPVISRGGFRVYVSRLDFEGERCVMKNIECLSSFEGMSPFVREKNWVPFEYNQSLFLAYSLNPHFILSPQLLGNGHCETFALSQGHIQWDWGTLRGGTPGLLHDGKYLAFFHSSKDMATLHSEGKSISHYFIGAYTFQSHPPFSITSISPSPIIGKQFYHGKVPKPYWKSLRVVFPGGYISDGEYIWMVYGRQDRELWVVKLDKKGLLQSLVPVSPIENDYIPMCSKDL